MNMFFVSFFFCKENLQNTFIKMLGVVLIEDEFVAFSSDFRRGN